MRNGNPIKTLILYNNINIGIIFANRLYVDYRIASAKIV